MTFCYHKHLGAKNIFVWYSVLNGSKRLPFRKPFFGKFPWWNFSLWKISLAVENFLDQFFHRKFPCLWKISLIKFFVENFLDCKKFPYSNFLSKIFWTVENFLIKFFMENFLDCGKLSWSVFFAENFLDCGKLIWSNFLWTMSLINFFCGKFSSPWNFRNY